MRHVAASTTSQLILWIKDKNNWHLIGPSHKKVNTIFSGLVEGISEDDITSIYEWITSRLKYSALVVDVRDNLLLLNGFDKQLNSNTQGAIFNNSKGFSAVLNEKNIVKALVEKVEVQQNWAVYKILIGNNTDSGPISPGDVLVLP